MRLKLLIAGLLALLPFPALADVTAHYTAGSNAVTIEVDDGGNFRAELSGKATLLRRDGVDYIVVQSPTGKAAVVRADDVLNMLRAQMAKPDSKPPSGMSMDFTLVSGGDETVAEHAGTLWRFGPAGKSSVTGTAPPMRPREQVEFVVSADPALAPVGGVFRHLLDTLAPVFLPAMGEGNFLTLAGELLAKGTPIRVGPVLTLESVDTTDVAAARFDLPGPALSVTEFMEAVGATASAAMPPLP